MTALCRDCGTVLDTTTAQDGLHPGCRELGDEIRWWRNRFNAVDRHGRADLAVRRRAQRMAQAATVALDEAGLTHNPVAPEPLEVP